MPAPPVDFHRINAVALTNLEPILARWLPNGRRRFREYTARNPTRNDRTAGSFRINLTTGRWADFATGDKGGDVISLAAYLHRLNQREAAKHLAVMLNIDPHQGETWRRP
ncbi:MAG: hypothetical protein ACKVRO_06975 [Micropepsaceae bacterium]